MRGRLLDYDIDAVLTPQTGGELFHRFAAARRQHEIDLLRRQQIRELNADALDAPVISGVFQ